MDITQEAWDLFDKWCKEYMEKHPDYEGDMADLAEVYYQESIKAVEG